MRLIDADAFKKQVAAMCIKNNGSTDTATALIDWIDLQPTAYDVDKVVEQINETREIFENRHIVPCINMDKATKIVRKGGVE